jgi:hypothetical protein
MAAAKKKPEVEQRDDFDAHQFQVMADAAYQVPRTARGGARDLLSKDEASATPSAQAALPSDSATRDSGWQPKPSLPTLAESQERQRFVNPQAPQTMDTIYREPERKATPAALDGARVRHGSDVHFRDPEVPQDVKFEFQEEDQDADPRARFIDALNGPAPSGDIPGVKQKGEDPRFTVKNGYRFYT